MSLIACIGLLIVLVSLWMIAAPEHWVRQAVRYCRWTYMHPLEIVICLSMGVVSLWGADQTNYATLVTGFGYVMCGVGLLLAVTPHQIHRRLGIQVIEGIGHWFRPAGFGSLAFGGYLMYIGWI
jgi:hypothetical protein